MSGYQNAIYKRVTVSDAAVPVEIGLPNKTLITLLRVAQVGAGAYNLTIYNRKFTGNAIAIHRIVDDGNTQAKLHFQAAHELRAGDTVTVSGSSVGGYDTDHVVTEVLDPQTVVTDQAYTADGFGGTGQLDIPAAVQPVFEVVEQQAASSGIVRFNGTRPFANLDVTPTSQNHHKAYFLFSATGTYDIVVHCGQYLL